MMLFLIPVTDALSALREHFTRYANDDVSGTSDQVREMAELTAKFVPVSRAGQTREYQRHNVNPYIQADAKLLGDYLDGRHLQMRIVV